MLKKRIIPVVLYRGEQVVKGQRFESWRSIGHVRQAVQVHNAREVDELIALDIGATPEGREPNFELIKELTSEFFAPLTVGGGIRTLEHFQKALASGADKVCICTAALENPGLITEAARRFGSQAVVVSVDYRWMWYESIEHAGCNILFSQCGKRTYQDSPSVVVWAQEVQALGAGEILLNSIDRDGMMEGYDLKKISAVSSKVSIPVVACGGCGSYRHMAEAFDFGASAVAAGAFFVWEDATPAKAAKQLAQWGYPVRRVPLSA